MVATVWALSSSGRLKARDTLDRLTPAMIATWLMVGARFFPIMAWPTLCSFHLRGRSGGRSFRLGAGSIVDAGIRLYCGIGGTWKGRARDRRWGERFGVILPFCAPPLHA